MSFRVPALLSPVRHAVVHAAGQTYTAGLDTYAGLTEVLSCSVAPMSPESCKLPCQPESLPFASLARK